MELRHLRYFRSVAEAQGFSRSARALSVSQSAISEQIADLEREVGAQLLVRGQQRVRLTPHGEIFLVEARKVLAAAEHAIKAARRSARGEVGRINIGFFAGGAGTFVPKIIRDFRRNYPDVLVSLSEMTPTAQSQALVDGTIDVGFTRPPSAPFDQQLKSELLYFDSLMAVLPKDHRLALGPVDLRDLAGERFVLCARDSSHALFDKIISLCSEAGFSPDIATTSVVWSSVAMLVQAGEGVAILPSNLQQRGSMGLAFCPLMTPTALIPLVMAWSPQRAYPIQQAFIELVREHRQRTKGAADTPQPKVKGKFSRSVGIL